jgi:phospholipid/cholesterol/gamma-HCH transport system permease protein
MRTDIDDAGNLIVSCPAKLNADSVPSVWREMEHFFRNAPSRLILIADEVEYCDTAGIALLFWIRLQSEKHGFAVEFRGLKDDFSRMLDMFDPDKVGGSRVAKSHPGYVWRTGHFAAGVFSDIVEQVSFLGQLFAAIVSAPFRRRGLRWKEMWRTAELAGANAVFIVSLIGFLFGLIMAFSSAMPLRRFGADVYVSDLAAIALVRVLGPFITAIILAGRSGSAYAAEIGTMKVNDEIDALQTMGLDPVGFLVVPKVLATIAITPLLTIITDVFGLVGSGVVILSLGFPLVTYTTHVKSAIDSGDVLLGLFKALVFGGLIAGVGCLRGLQTKTDAASVGESTTRAVVSGIVLIVVAEGVFAVFTHFVGI